LFPAAFKTDANAQRISNIMNNYKTGQISLDQAQKMVTEQAGGIILPSWFNRGKDVTKTSGMSPSSFKSAGPVGVLSALTAMNYLNEQKQQSTPVPGGLTMPSARAVSESLDRSNQSRSASTALSILDALDPAFIAPQPLGGGIDTMEGYLRSQAH
jgi:hypothetical protein